MIIVHTGSGKGKTTAAVGQIIRALARGAKVCLIQLFKGREFYGEQKILVKLKNLDFFSFAPKHPLCFPEVRQESVKQECDKALALLDKIASGRKQYRLIVLEEFNIALRDHCMELAPLLTILSKFSPDTDIIVTGRGAPRKLIQEAELVTEMKEVKHPYQKGIKAKKGREF
jgi:cob(I)alamin adenosyltransferase